MDLPATTDVRALVVRELTGPDGVHVGSFDIGVGATDQVLVRVSAAGLGFVDTLVARGLYQERPSLPFVPGLEFAGDVEWAPAGSRFTVGDRVVGHSFGGSCAELVWAAPHHLAATAAELDDVEAASSIINHHTAILALERRAHVRPGERVLVHGAGGGLGSAFVQVAAALGAEVHAVASTPARRAVAARAGADVVHEPDAWLESLRASGGADVVVDPVGGEVFDRSLRCLAPEGRLLTVGFASGIIPSAPANRLLLRNSSVVGFGLRELLAIDSTVFEATARRLDQLVGNGMRPLVGEVYELELGAQAFRAIEDRSAVGKTVLRVAPS